MSEPDRPESLAALGERLERARRALGKKPHADGGGADQSSGAALSLGLRIGLELVVAVAVGVAIGWAIDHWLGTRPWGLLVFLFLGIGAGMTNVYRAVRGMSQAVGYRNGVQRGKEDDWDED